VRAIAPIGGSGKVKRCHNSCTGSRRSFADLTHDGTMRLVNISAETRDHNRVTKSEWMRGLSPKVGDVGNSGRRHIVGVLDASTSSWFVTKDFPK
jgi:hypothetical protein